MVKAAQHRRERYQREKAYGFLDAFIVSASGFCPASVTDPPSSQPVEIQVAWIGRMYFLRVVTGPIPMLLSPIHKPRAIL